MATQAGKVHVHEIKQGKTFYLVHADFPIIEASLVGNGEVSTTRRIRVTGRPFYRKLSASMAFTYVDDRGNEGWVNLDHMVYNHTHDELPVENPYFVVLTTRHAVNRFIKSFDGRSPTQKETMRTLLREANLAYNQRSYT